MAKTKKKMVRLLLTIDEAESLAGFIDGGIGTSDCDHFSKQFGHILKKLDKSYNKVINPTP